MFLHKHHLLILLLLRFFLFLLHQSYPVSVMELDMELCIGTLNSMFSIAIKLDMTVKTAKTPPSKIIYMLSTGTTGKA